MRTLADSPADVVASLLVDLGVATAASAWAVRGTSGGKWPAFVNGEPPLPDDVLTVYDTAGSDHGSTMFDGELQGHYGFQVRVRSSNPQWGWLKADEVRVSLAQAVNDANHRYGGRSVRVGSNLYAVHNVAGIGPTIVLGKSDGDKERTWLFTVNALLNVDQTTA